MQALLRACQAAELPKVFIYNIYNASDICGVFDVQSSLLLDELLLISRVAAETVQEKDLIK